MTRCRPPADDSAEDAIARTTTGRLPVGVPGPISYYRQQAVSNPQYAHSYFSNAIFVGLTVALIRRRHHSDHGRKVMLRGIHFLGALLGAIAGWLRANGRSVPASWCYPVAASCSSNSARTITSDPSCATKVRFPLPFSAWSERRGSGRTRTARHSGCSVASNQGFRCNQPLFLGFG